MIDGIGERGTTLLHRLPAGGKLAGLAIVATLLFFVSNPALLAAAVPFGAAAMLATGRPPAVLLHQIAVPAITIALVGLADLLLVDAETALVVVLRLAALLAFALAVTLTTTSAELADTFERALAPFDRAGLVDAPRAALTLTLAIRFVPLVGQEIAAIREAQAVRGLAANPVALAVPLIVRILVRAERVAEAIDARGFPPPRPDRSRSPTSPMGGAPSPSQMPGDPHDHP
jgi:biotin transport system permease protein